MNFDQPEAGDAMSPVPIKTNRTSKRGPRRIITKKLADKLDRCARQLRDVQNEILERTPLAHEIVFPERRMYTWTARELVEEFLSVYQMRESTRDTRRYMLGRFLKEAGDSIIRLPLVERWYSNLMKSSLSWNTKVVHWGCMVTFLTWAFNSKRIEDNIPKMIKGPGGFKLNVRPTYSREEYEALKSFFDGHPRYDYFGFLIRLGWNTGMAISDCCNLTWECVDMNQCIIRKNRQKTDVEAIICFEFGGELHTALKRQEQETIRRFGKVQPHLPVCREVYQRGHYVVDNFKNAVEKSGQPYKQFHCLRATFISACANNSVNLSLAMKMAGIRSAHIFTQYVTPDIETLRREVIRIRK